jgi:hypothetical protein
MMTEKFNDVELFWPIGLELRKVRFSDRMFAREKGYGDSD